MADDSFDALIELRLNVDQVRRAINQVLQALGTIEQKLQKLSVSTGDMTLQPDKVKIELPDRIEADDRSIRAAAQKVSAAFVEELKLASRSGQVEAALKGLTGGGKAGVQLRQSPAFAQSPAVDKLNQALGRYIELSQKAGLSTKEMGAAQSLLGQQQTKLIAFLRKTEKRTGDWSNVINVTRAALDRLNDAQDRLNRRMIDTGVGIDAAKQKLREKRIETTEFTKRLDIAIFKLIRYRVAFTVLHKTILELKDTVQVFAEVDLALARLAKVLPPIGTNLEAIKKSAFALGKEFAVSIKEVLKSMQIWAQMGLTQQETLKATEAALLAVNATGLSASEATNAITAAIFAYGVAVEDVTQVVDKWLKVQAEFPVTAGDLAKALFKAGAAAQDFGISMDELNGLVASIGAVTRASGTEVGNSLKTIFARIPREETVKKFQDIGVAVFKNEKEFRNLYDILSDLAEKWKDLTDEQRVNIAQSAAGIRQYVKFIALMNNFELAQDAAAASQQSFGASLRANLLEVQTLSKAWESLGVAFDELKTQIGTDLAKPIAVIVDLLRALGSGPVQRNISKTIAAIASFATAFVVLKGTQLAFLFVWRQFAGTELAKGIASIIAAKNATLGMKLGFDGATSSLVTFSSVLRGTLLSINFWVIAISAIVAAFTLFGKEVKKFGGQARILTTSQEDYIKSLASSIKGIDKEIEALNKAVAKRGELVDKLEEAKKGTKDYEIAQKRLQVADEQLLKLENDFGRVIDANSSKLADQTLIMDELKGALEKIIKQKTELKNIEEDALKREIARFRETELERTHALELGIKNLNNAYAELQKLSSGFRKIDLEIFKAFPDDKEFEIPLSGFDEIKKKVTETFEEMAADVTGTSLPDEFQAIVNEMVDKSERGAFLISKFGVQLLRSVADNPELTEAIKAELDEIIEQFKAGVQTTKILAKETKDSVLLAADADRIFDSVLDKVSERFLALPGIASDMSLALSAQLGDIKAFSAAIKNLFSGEDTSTEKFIADFTKIRGILKTAADKFSELQYKIKTGAAQLNLFNELARASGAPIKTMNRELATFYLDVANNIATFGDTFDKMIFQNNQEIKTLQDRLADGHLTATVVQDMKDRIKLLEDQNKELDQQKDKYEKMLPDIKRMIAYAKEFNEQLKESAFSLSILEDLTTRSAKDTKKFADIRKQLGFSEKSIVEFEKERLDVEAQLVLKQLQFVEAKDRENFITAKSKDLADQQLDIMQRIATIDFERSFESIQSGIKSFTSAIESTFTSIPDIIEEGFTKRKDLTKDLYDAEQELQSAIRKGDKESIDSAREKISELRDELDKYKKGWYELKTIISNLVGSISSATFENISKQFAQALSDLQLGDQSLGQAMGTAIAGKFDESAVEFAKRYQEQWVAQLDNEERIYRDFLNELEKILSRHFPEIGPPAPITLGENEKLNVPKIEVDKKELESASQRAFKIGGVLAGQIISRSMGQAGGRVGQDIAATLQTVIPAIFNKTFKDNPLGLTALGIGTGILGGLLGGLFGKDDTKKLPEAIDKNTEALERNTIVLQEFDKNVFNAPPRFVIPPFSGNVTTGGANISIESVNLNVQSAGVSGRELVDEFIGELENRYNLDLAGSRNRGRAFII